MEAHLSLGISRWDADQYCVDLRFERHDDAAPVQPRQSQPLRMSLPEVQALAADPARYGRALTDALFSDPPIRETFLQALANAQANDVKVRLTFYISPNIPELHALRWETLLHPQHDVCLSLSEQVYFSRYYMSSDWRRVRPEPEQRSSLRALLAIANPLGLENEQPMGRGLAPVDVVGERTRARGALGGLQIAELSSLAPADGSAVPPRATLDGLMAGLRAGCDIMYLVCHGAIVRGEPYLWLENENGAIDRVTGAEFLVRLRELAELPRLVVLASCQSAGGGGAARTGDEGALAGLAPRLVEAGIPAVLAMQGNITMETLGLFMPLFFSELMKDGIIDKAMAIARGAVRDRIDWWAPTLYLRLKTGRVWGATERRPQVEVFGKWDSLLSNLSNGKCTPILGSALLEPLLGSTQELARRWAEVYRFPLAQGQQVELSQIAQYLEVMQDRQLPRRQLENYLRRILRNRFSAELAALPKDASVDELLVAAGRAMQQRDTDEVHQLLAALPCPVYISTNADSLLFDTLQRTPFKDEISKQPLRRVFGREEDPLSATPHSSVSHPLIYHLFGHLDDVESLVLTEDDYFKYLIDVTGKRRQLPSDVRERLTNSSLIFLGFRLEEWDFRVLLRSLDALESNGLLSRYTQVAVQLDPRQGRFLDPESARQYLANHTKIGEKAFSIIWSDTRAFLMDLSHRWRTRSQDF